MAGHSVALNLPLLTAYRTKYSVPDSGSLKTFQT